jgi:hypothetical protein
MMTRAIVGLEVKRLKRCEKEIENDNKKIREKGQRLRGEKETFLRIRIGFGTVRPQCTSWQY